MSNYIVDQPTSQPIIASGGRKSKHLVLIKPSVEPQVLVDEELLPNGSIEGLKPSTLKSLAIKYGAEYSKDLYFQVERVYLDTQLRSESILDLCIDDSLVRVTIHKRGISLYSYMLGIDQVFATIEDLNVFLLNKRGIPYFSFEEDIPFGSVKALENDNDYYINASNGEILARQDAVSVAVANLTDLDFLSLLNTYHKETGQVTLSKQELSSFALKRGYGFRVFELPVFNIDNGLVYDLYSGMIDTDLIKYPSNILIHHNGVYFRVREKNKVPLSEYIVAARTEEITQADLDYYNGKSVILQKGHFTSKGKGLIEELAKQRGVAR